MPCRIDASAPLVYQTWMVNPDPKVTVVMAAYNWSAVLPYSIGSVLAQTCADFELWVVGDACTDDSEQVVASIQDPRVHWCNLATNVGQQGGPNNEGIRRARGQYIAYLGHDDLWLPHHLESLVSVMESGADVAWGVVSLLLENQKGVLMPHEPQKYRPGMWIPPTGIMHRKDLAQKVGGWRLYDEITMDPETDLLLRMHEAGGEFRFAPRLTALKFPAARRKNVYSDKPCHEQAVWSQKMKEGADLERDQLLKIAANPFGTAAILVGLWLRAKVDVCSEFLLGYKKGVFNRRRKFKGLAPKS